MTYFARMIVLVALIVTGYAAKAEESKMMLIRSGIFCDSQEDLEIFMTKTSLNGGKFPKGDQGTCGRFVPREVRHG